MKLFFEICKEFFDLLYLPFVSDIIENEIIKDDLEEELDEEKGYNEETYIEERGQEEENQDEKDNQDYEYIQYIQEKKDIQNNQYIQKKHDIEENIEEHNEDVCSCEFLIQSLSIINARIYKQLNGNKSE
jgi:hypothetical protein